MRRRLAIAVLLVALPAVAETRYHELSHKAKGSDGKVKILASTLLGGDGAEELVGVAYGSDGSLLVAGNAWGPEAPPATSTVWGPDGYRDAKVWADETRHTLDRGNPNRSGFFARLKPDLSEVDTTTRFGWGTATITSLLVAADGATFVAGVGRDPFVGWARGLPGPKLGPPDAGQAGGSAQYLLRVSRDLRRVEWAAVFERAQRQGGLRFRLLGDKALVLQAYGRLYTLNTDGNALRDLGPSPGGLLLATDPKGDGFWLGGDESVGHTPWRRPFLLRCDADGQVQAQLWRWDTKAVSEERYRLPADSRIDGVLPLAGGHILAWGQSAGADSVFLRQPTRLDVKAPLAAGFANSLAGAGLGSFGWLLHVDPAKLEVTAATTVSAYLPDRDQPNSSRIDAALVLSRGRIAVVGSSAFAFVETPDAWVRTYPKGAAGAYLAIFNETLTDLLFGSLLPGVEAPLSLARRGSQLAVVGTAVQPVKRDDALPPLVKAKQGQIRGEADGYVLVAETGSGAPLLSSPGAAAPSPP